MGQAAHAWDGPACQSTCCAQARAVAHGTTQPSPSVGLSIHLLEGFANRLVQANLGRGKGETIDPFLKRVANLQTAPMKSRVGLTYGSGWFGLDQPHVARFNALLLCQVRSVVPEVRAQNHFPFKEEI